MPTSDPTPALQVTMRDVAHAAVTVTSLTPELLAVRVGTDETAVTFVGDHADLTEVFADVVHGLSVKASV